MLSCVCVCDQDRLFSFSASPFHAVTLSVLVQKSYLANIFLSGFTQSVRLFSLCSSSWENRLHFRHVYDYGSGNQVRCILYESYTQPQLAEVIQQPPKKSNFTGEHAYAHGHTHTIGTRLNGPYRNVAVCAVCFLILAEIGSQLLICELLSEPFLLHEPTHTFFSFNESPSTMYKASPQNRAAYFKPEDLNILNADILVPCISFLFMQI